MIKQILFTFIGVCLLQCTLFAQSTTSEKRKIKVQMYVDGKLHPSNQTLTKSDKNILLKAYNAETNQELAIALMDVSLIRNGQKIANLTLSSNGSIEKLAAKAKNNDNYVFELKQVLELAEDLSLKPYSHKSFKVNYTFFDSELDASKVIVGAN
jgi:hypothetical protein